MSKQPLNYQTGAGPQSTSPKQKTPRFRFRWNLVWIIVALVIFLYILNGADPSFSFGDFMDFIDIYDEDRFRKYFTLGCICVAIVAIIRVLSKNKKGKRR